MKNFAKDMGKNTTETELVKGISLLINQIPAKWQSSKIFQPRVLSCEK